MVDIILGEDDWIFLVIGFCFFDNEEVVLEYVCCLFVLQKKVVDKIFMVMCVYIVKFCINGDGYKGLVY